MTAVFDDTFYWLTLVIPSEAAHKEAIAFKGGIVTTGEMLSEYLTFFAKSPDYIRRAVGISVYDIFQKS